MKTLSKIETQEWCRRHSIALDDFGCPKVNHDREKFLIPHDAGQRTALVKNQLQFFRDEDEILVWFTEWSVWPSGGRMHIFDRMRLSYGESRSLIESPGHFFAREEFEDALSFLTLGVLFLWDCYVLNRTGTKALFYSHDEFGYRTSGK